MEKTENRGMLEIDLKHMLLVILGRLWIVILVAVLCGALALGYAWFFITPTYGASVQFYVNNQVTGSPGFSSSQITAAQSLADTYMVILHSRTVLEEVAKKTNLGYTYGQIRGMLDAAAINKTEVFQVDVICTNYSHSAIIANAIADVLPDKITSVVEGSSVRVVDRAVENPNRIAPSYTNNTILGAAVGAIVTMVIIVLLELLDTTINSEEYLSHAYEGVPLLAVIPDGTSTKGKYYRGYYKGSYEAEQKKTPTKKVPAKKEPPKTAEKNNGGAEK